MDLLLALLLIIFHLLSLIAGLPSPTDLAQQELTQAENALQEAEREVTLRHTQAKELDALVELDPEMGDAYAQAAQEYESAVEGRYTAIERLSKVQMKLQALDPN